MGGGESEVTVRSFLLRLTSVCRPELVRMFFCFSLQKSLHFTLCVMIIEDMKVGDANLTQHVKRCRIFPDKGLQ